MKDPVVTLEEIQNIKTILAIRSESDVDKKFELMLNISPSNHSNISRNYWHQSEADLIKMRNDLQESLEKNLQTIQIESL